jgi:hypothetical protein
LVSESHWILDINQKRKKKKKGKKKAKNYNQGSLQNQELENTGLHINF